MVGPAKIVQRHFEYVTDPRANRGCNHDLLEMVFVDRKTWTGKRGQEKEVRSLFLVLGRDDRVT